MSTCQLLALFAMVSGSLFGQVKPPVGGNPFTISSYGLQASIGSNLQSSGNGPLFFSHEVFGVLGNPSLRVTGTLGFFDGDRPFHPAARFEGPLSLRFTDALIECYGGTGNCSSFRMEMMAAFSTANTTGSSVVPRFVGIEGLASVATPKVLEVTLGTGVLPTLSVPLGSGAFSESVALGTAFIGGNSSIMLGLNVPRLASGESISLPDSLWYSFNSAVPTNIPEPGSVLLVGAAIAGAVWLRRNSRA
jgi:hypothetical protein